MRLIDADELEEKVWRLKLDSRELIAKMIEDAPTVDAVPVVRCKDCKYYEMDSNETYGWCEENECPFAQLDYCSYGITKGDN